MDYNKQMKMLFVGTIILSITLVLVNAIESATFPLPEFIVQYELQKAEDESTKLYDYKIGDKLKENKININTATIAELDLLPGIGEVTARLIIEYREEFGPFKSINHLLDVPRIGEKTLEKIKPYITVGEKDPKELIKGNV